MHLGGHPSLIRFYLAELVEALEHMHKHAIVHRDLKAENILIASSGHIVVIDFGTAKDLEKTDLNGPEFVGTPDFMSPEAVKATDEKLPDGEGADHTADLWALGVLAYQLYTGHPCFMSQSPYLTFLRIQRGNIFRPYAVTDDDAWDLITKLVQVDPNKRLGANCVVNNGEARRKPGNLADIRNHSFFKRGNFQLGGIMDFAAYAGELILNIGCLGKSKAIRIPALKDLCILACADLVS